MNNAEKLAQKKAQEIKLAKMNAEKAKIAKFLEERAVKAEAIKVTKAERKSRARTGDRKLGKENYLLLAIYNAGDEGITFEQLVKMGLERVDPESGKTEWISPTTDKTVYSAVSEITTNHNWNVQETTTQRGELKLREPSALDANTKKESIGEVYFTSEDTGKVSKESVRKNNNRITLVIGHEIVKAYLLAHGAKEEQF